MYQRKYTPEAITELQENEVFVFGSNEGGLHMGGAANVAYHKFGAFWGRRQRSSRSVVCYSDFG